MTEGGAEGKANEAKADGIESRIDRVFAQIQRYRGLLGAVFGALFGLMFSPAGVFETLLGGVAGAVLGWFLIGYTVFGWFFGAGLATASGFLIFIAVLMVVGFFAVLAIVVATKFIPLLVG